MLDVVASSLALYARGLCEELNGSRVSYTVITMIAI